VDPRILRLFIEFASKYHYLFHHSTGQESTIFTDHKPLTYFLNSSFIEGIYSGWAADLRALNLTIDYVPGKKNKTADALSKTIFLDLDCQTGPVLEKLGEVGRDDETDDPKWIWKMATVATKNCCDCAR